MFQKRTGRNKMGKLSDDLFLTISDIVNIRVTPDNLRSTMKAISASGGITNAVKTAIIIELLLDFVKLEEKITKNVPPG